MKKLIFLIFTAVIISGTYSAAIYAQEISEISITAYGYGTVEKTGITEVQKDTAAGRLNIVNNFVISEQTDKIPSKIGTTFGIKYIVKGRPIGANIAILVRWTHPPITPSGKKTAVITEEAYRYKTIGKETFIIYTFEEEWELMPGKWTCQLFHKDKLLAEKSFEIFRSSI
jgi:hypothetical protein